jgi:ribose 5-phosphate isomerase B
MPRRPLITESAVREAARAGRTTLAVTPQTLVTALARDTARDLGVSFTEADPPAKADCGCPPSPTGGGRPPAAPAPPKSLVVASDHAGFPAKSDLVAHARALGWTVTDLGTDSAESVDYPDFAFAVARLVARGEAALGVMIDGVGVGSAMVANKVPGVRAACCAAEFAAFNARAHNDANVLTLGSRTVGPEVNKRVLETFLTTAFEGGRHAARVEKIADVEARFLPTTDAL